MSTQWIMPWHRPVLSLVGAVSVAILLTLGTWQVQRLAWKQDLMATVNARVASAPTALAVPANSPGDLKALEYTPVTVSGTWAGPQVALVTGTYEGRAGYYSFGLFQLETPLAAGQHVVINRGFVDLDAVGEPPAFPVTKGPATVTGLVRTFMAQDGLAAQMAPAADLDRALLYRRVQADFVAFFGTPTLPVYVDAGLSPAGGVAMPHVTRAAMPRGGTTRVTFSNNHLGYAITWYGLAIGLVAIYGVMMRRRVGEGADH